ncbi:MULTISPECIES: hypothetical protein [unclassified Bartonella]
MCDGAGLLLHKRKDGGLNGFIVRKHLSMLIIPLMMASWYTVKTSGK